MSYSKLSNARKKTISVNANKYTKDNYRQILLRLKRDVADMFDSACEAEKLSRAEMLKKLLETYSI